MKLNLQLRTLSLFAGDVTVGTWKMKITCADRVSVGLLYDANLKWHTPICEEICRLEQKYMPFFGAITERAFQKKNQSTETYKNDATMRFGFFLSAKRAR